MLSSLLCALHLAAELGPDLLSLDDDTDSSATKSKDSSRNGSSGAMQHGVGVADADVLVYVTAKSASSCGSSVAQGGYCALREEDDRPLLRLSQTLLDPLQQVLAHGCHLQRDTPAAVIDAFGGASCVVRLQRMVNKEMWPVSQQAAGVVIKPSGVGTRGKKGVDV